MKGDGDMDDGYMGRSMKKKGDEGMGGSPRTSDDRGVFMPQGEMYDVPMIERQHSNTPGKRLNSGKLNGGGAAGRFKMMTKKRMR